MLFLVELDHVKSGTTPTPEAGRTFIEQIILPTITTAEQLLDQKKVLAGGPVLGCIALRFIVEAASAQEVDRLVTSLPLWTVAETRITPLVSFSDRRQSVRGLFDQLGKSPGNASE
jgi:hypothetical protein